MASSCFRLEATRGPHSGIVVSYCHVEAAAASAKSSDLSIGRKKRCWLRLPKDLEVSSAHAEFRFVEGGKRVAIRDSKSTNGTKLNGNPLKPHQNYQLNNGDLVAVGKTSLRFVQIAHGQQCGEEAEDNIITTANNSGLTPSAASSVAKVAGAPEVIVLDADSENDFSVAVNVPSGAGPTDTPVDQPDTEPGLDEEPIMNGAVIDVNDKKITKPELNVEAAVEEKKRTGAVHGHTPVEATCIVCSAIIGRLDLLEQQAHLNECLGGRFAILAQLSGKAAPKSKKRGNTGDSAPRAKKPRKPKASSDADAAPKARKPRKRKRATDAGEDIELALALTGKTKLSKEKQTDAQLAVAKKKLEQLDEQMAKLVKRRVNLVKTLDRLERTKEKLRKSQVLPPAKVFQLLDLKAALDAIFPSNRQAQSADRFTNEQLMSAVAKRYIPSRWSDTEVAIDCDNEKHAELATVAAISMWSRASQQLFGLRRDTLLYRNSILRGYLGDEEEHDSSIHADDLGEGENENGDDGIDYEPEQELEEKVKPIASDHEVPDVVKRVFLNWQRDLAFLQEQTPGELEMALEAMNEAQAQADVADEASHPGSEDTGASKTEVAASENILLVRQEQRLACKYMTQVMMKLINEKKRHVDVVEYEELQQQDVELVSGEEVGKPQQDVNVIAASDGDAELETQPPVHNNTQKAAAFAAENCIKPEQKAFLGANSLAELHSME